MPVAWLKCQGWVGYRCLADIVVEKAFAKCLPWANRTHFFAEKRKVYGLHIVVLLWCSAGGHWQIPVAFRLWRPQRKCAKHDYWTKLHCLSFEYIVFMAAMPRAAS